MENIYPASETRTWQNTERTNKERKRQQIYKLRGKEGGNSTTIQKERVEAIQIKGHHRVEHPRQYSLRMQRPHGRWRTRGEKEGDNRYSGCRGCTDNEGSLGGRRATIERAMRADADAKRITKDQTGVAGR